MIPTVRFRRGFPVRLGWTILAAAIVAAGCSTSASSGGGGSVNHLTAQGTSVAGWLTPSGPSNHSRAATSSFIATGNAGGCTECHGADLLGGISRVSCTSNPAACHHGTVANWVVQGSGVQAHGAAAKRGPGGSSFFSCRICHGGDFSGGASKLSCFPCHGAAAPHPAKPWRSTTGGSNHSSTDPENAPVCKLCHFPGSPNNPANHPSTPAPAGTAPGCFNNTLCHGAGSAPHALGAGWVNATGSAFHGLTAKQDLKYCQGCHGTPGTTSFNGGVASTSCQSAGCHPQAKAHPIRWFQAPSPFPAYVSSHRDSGNRDVACAVCHKVDAGGTGPDPAAPSCFSASFNGANCHSGGPGGPNHAVPFSGTTHTAATTTTYTADCATCHAVTGTSPNSTAPPCTVCHVAGSPLSSANCASCHANPPAGAAYPNVAGRHAKHDALASVTGACGTCHNNLLPGSAGHYDRANARPGKDALRVPPGDVAFVSTYNAKAGPASFNTAALTCANVSCHGGVTTPDWQTGSINTATDAGCRQCHKIGTAVGLPENNSPYSGLHAFHLSTAVGGSILCTECHAMSNGSAGAQNHFRFLDTAAMEGPAATTVAPNGSAANFNPADQTCGTFTCHTVTHTGFSWTGGASHPVPFTGTAHTSVTSGTFAANCGACHFETGTETKTGPTCTVCHAAGSPLSNANCTSCHAGPPAGSTYPNVSGKHAAHAAFPGVTGCTPCHNGLGAGTLEHYNRANARPGKNALRVPPGDLSFLAAYNSKFTAASFNPAARTCANVSCHGGQTTPDWQTTTANAIDVPNACLSCHVSGTSQYNSFFSGKHSKHINEFGLSAATCKRCHDVTKVNVTGHFDGLATQAFEQLPRNTLNAALGYNGTSCNPSAGGLSGCHGSKNWQ